MEAQLQFGMFLGVLGASMLANGLSVLFFYAVFWGDAQNRRGRDESTFPLWFFAAGLVPPAICSTAIYLAMKVY